MMRVICVLFQNQKYISEFAEACYRITPQVAVGERGGVFLEIEKCYRLYSEKIILLKIKALLKRFGVKARVAVADDVFMSLVSARFGESDKTLLPLEAFYDVANPFKVEEEVQIKISHIIEKLKSLGLKTLDDYLKLPIKQITSRFQKQGLELYSRLLHGEREESLALWPRFVPLETTYEVAHLDYQDNCQSLEPLLFIIKATTSRAMARLVGKGERASKISLRFDLEKFSTVNQASREWIFNFPLSQGSVHGVLPLIRERLDYDLNQKPLESSVTRLEIKVLESVPGQYFQRHFFNKKEEEQDVWNALINRLCEKMGRESESRLPAFVAEPIQSYTPEKAWRRTLPESMDIPGEPSKDELTGVDIPLPSRPLRLLKKPQRLRKEGNTLVNEHASAWEIQDWEGPERLKSEWWGEELKRDYFRVGTSCGEQLWVFRIPDSDLVFLHGYFS
jgi:protein ImuB